MDTNTAHTAYRISFMEAVADGSATPLLIPYILLGTFVAPALWLTIPHIRRPILYQTRWLLMAFIIVFNARLTRQSSSTNLAFAYAIGLTTGWGIILNLNLLIWTRPQFDAARAIKSPRRLRRAKTTYVSAEKNPPCKAQSSTSERDARIFETSELREAADDVFVWQPFPADGSFLQRLGWVLDLWCSFRGSGERCTSCRL